MITIYTVQQGELDYDDNYYYLKSAKFGKIVGQFIKKEEAEELRQKLIDFTYNRLENKIDWVDLSDHFEDYKRPYEVEGYEKLHALKEELECHVTIQEYKLDDSHIIHPDNKNPLKTYCGWKTLDADTSNKQNNYIDMDYDDPEYESILEQVMDIAERRFDAGYGFSWLNIEYAWDTYLESYSKKND
jgi:hypothetical protein